MNTESTLFAALLTFCIILLVALYRLRYELEEARHTADHYERVHEDLTARLDEATELLYRAAHRDEEHRRIVEGYRRQLAQMRRCAAVSVPPAGRLAEWRS